MEVRSDVEKVHDLGRARLVLGGNAPIPGGTVAKQDTAPDAGEAAPLGLSPHAPGEGGRLGVAAGRTFNRTGVAGGAGVALGKAPSRSAAAISRPSASARRSTCLVCTRTPASLASRAEISAKLTRAAAEPVMRSTAGESESPSSPRAASRGKQPYPQGGQW